MNVYKNTADDFARLAAREAAPGPAPAQRDEVRDRPSVTVVDEKGEPVAEGDYAFHQGNLSELGQFSPDRKGRAYLGQIDPAKPFVFEVRDRVCAIRYGAFLDPNDPAIEYGGTWFDWALVRDDVKPDLDFWPHYKGEMDLSFKRESANLTPQKECDNAPPGLRVDSFLQHEHVTRRPIQIARPYVKEPSKVRICATPARVRVGPFVRYADHERAVIWLETFSPAMARVRYRKSGGGAVESSCYASTVRVGGRHFAAVELLNLAEDSFHDYTVELAPLPAAGDVPVGQAELKTAFPKLTPAVLASMKSQFAQTSLDGTEWATFRTLRKVYDSRLRFATGSCRWYPGDVGKDDKKQDKGVCVSAPYKATIDPKKLRVKDKDWGPDMLKGLGQWLLEHAKDKEVWPHFLFFCGDQIYADEMGVDHGKMLAVGRFAARVPGPADPAPSLRDKLIDGAWAGRFAHRYRSYKQPDPRVVEKVAVGIRQIDAIHHCIPSIQVAAKTDPLTDPRQVLKRDRWAREASALEALTILDTLERASEPFRAHLFHWGAGSNDAFKQNPSSRRFLSLNFLLWSLPTFEQHLPTLSARQNIPVVLGPDGRGHPSAEGGRHAADFAEYAYLYERAWTSSRCVRVLLAHIPTFLMFDDHEVTDDWNFDVSWVRMLHNPKDDFQMWPKTLTDALAAYWVYQGWGNNAPSKWKADDPRVKALDDARRRGLDALPELRRCIHRACLADVPPEGPNAVFQTGLSLSWHYKLPFDPPFIVPDCRTRKKLYESDEGLRIIDHDSKSAPKSQTIDDYQLDWMSKILLGCGGKVAFVGTSTPLLMQKKLMKIMMMPEIAALPWAQGLDILSLAAALFDSPGLGRGSDALLKVFRRGKDLEHIIRDRSWRQLWEIVGKMNQQGSPVKSLIFVSGDVHHSYNMTANLHGKGRPTPELVQITSSGLQTIIRGSGKTELAEDLSSFPFDLGQYHLVPGFMSKNNLDDADVALFENSVALVEVGIGREVNIVATHISTTKNPVKGATTDKHLDKYVFKYTSGPEYMERGMPVVLARDLKKRDREFSRLAAPRHEGVGAAFEAVSPVAVYDAFAREGRPALRRQFEPAFEVLAAPGALLSEQLREGDLLVRRGEGGLGHLAVIAAPVLWRREQIESAGLRPEGARAGLYAQVVEGGAFPHTTGDGFARLVADPSGRVPHNQLVLRPRQSPLSQGNLQSEDWAEAEPPANVKVLPPLTPPQETPGGLLLLPHWHQRGNCDNGKSFTFAKDATPMTPPVMNPGFLKADGEIDVDPVLQKRLSELILDTPAHAALLTKESRDRRRPSRDDKIRVALVDLTKDKICKPRYAGWGDAVNMFAASAVKIVMLYAAHQLVFDLDQMAQAGGIGNVPDLKKKVNGGVWSRVVCKPDVNWLVKYDTSAKPPKVVASDALTDALEKMITAPGSNEHANELIYRLGFEYMASVLWSSGLRHPKRGGLWLGSTFIATPPGAGPNLACHEKDPKSSLYYWKQNPLGRFTVAITALSAATYLTLLAQRRLVSETDSIAMESLLARGCGSFPVHTLAKKCGWIGSTASHDVGLLESDGRVYALVILTPDPPWPERTQFMSDVDKIIKDLNP